MHWQTARPNNPRFYATIKVHFSHWFRKCETFEGSNRVIITLKSHHNFTYLATISKSGEGMKSTSTKNMNCVLALLKIMRKKKRD